MSNQIQTLKNTLAVRTAKRGKIVSVAGGVAQVSTDTGETLSVAVTWAAKSGDRVAIRGGAAVKVPGEFGVLIVEV